MPGGKPPVRQHQQKKRGGYPAYGSSYPMYGSNYPPYSGPGSNFNKKKRPNPSNPVQEGDEPPIDSLFRILCPIRKIGSVLGRGGDIIKALRAETNAKILVADPVPGSDDRVVIIYSLVTDRSDEGEPDQDQGEIVTSSTNEDESGEGLKPLCPAQDALLKVNDRIAADELYHGGGEEIEVTARILIPRNQAGCVIGKGGAIIKQMRDETGAGIKVLPPEFLPPCAMRSDELVQISGIPALVKKALYEISTKLHVNPRKEQPPLNEIIYTSTHGGFSSPPPHPPPPYENQWGPPRGPPGPPGPPPPPSFGYDGGYRDTSAYGYSKKFDEFVVRVLCPAWRIGGIIGKRGNNVRRLEDETGAHLQVEETIDEEERVLAVSAKETLSEPVSQTIKFLVQIQSNTSPSDESVITKLLVPSQKVGCIIGEGGNIINDMRRRTGAGIRVYTKEMRPLFISPDDELVEIAGNPHTAREALIDVCTRLRTRTLRGGDSVPATAAPYDYPPSEGGGYAPPPAGPGYPPAPGPSYPPAPATHGYPPYAPPPSGPSYPPPASGYPPEVSGYPPPAGGYPPPSSGYPPPASGYAPPVESGYAPPPSSGYHAPPPAASGYAPPPAESGYPPAGNSYPPPAGGSYPPPASGGYPPPASGGYPPPVSGSYPPASGSYPPPAGSGYAQPAGTGYPPAGSEYPPPASSVYPQPAAECAYPAPAAGGYAPPVAGSGYPPQSGHGYPAPVGSGYPPADSGYPPPATQGTNKSPTPVSTAPPASGYHGYPPQSTAQVAGPAHETQGYAGQPAPPGYHASSGSLEMRIPTTAVEFVIGADGSNINEIRKISGAKVTVRDPAPGSSECVVEILGSSEQIQSAQGLVHAYMAQQTQPKADPPPVQYSAPPTWN